MNYTCVRFLNTAASRFNRNAIHYAALVFVGFGLAPVLLMALPPENAPQDREAMLSKLFRCPEEYPSDEAKRSALHDFMQNYAAQFPKQ